MERTINSLTYKGSIPDAINQSRRDKKLFVVYISGEDETSSTLEQSTLADELVAKLIERCCIFLHLKQGNVDALQFSAIYPQNSIPSISVIGLNGVMLWHHEGYISSEDLKEIVEKAWAALCLQETTATLLTASIASRMAEPVITASTTPATQGGLSTSEISSSSSSQSGGTTVVSGFADSTAAGTTEVSRFANSTATGNTEVSGFANSTDLLPQLPSSTINDQELLNINEKEGSQSDSISSRSVKQKIDSASTEDRVALPDCLSTSSMDNYTNPNQTGTTSSPKKVTKVDESCTTVPLESGPSAATGRGVSKQLPVNQDKATTASAPNKIISSSVKSDDIQLVIRMPNGQSLQVKLTKSDLLRKVKNFVDENQGSGIGSYDLAMLYPRKVFMEQDMETTLSELGIETRQALSVIPHRRSANVARHQSSSSSNGVDYNTDAGSSGGWGYFDSLKTVLPYVNPLSYLRGNPTSSNPEQLANETSQQYRPSSTPWNRAGMETASERQQLPGNGNQQASSDSSGSTLRRRPRQFGGNVHTLRSDDQGPSDDRNVFWNGNSTEFGGNEKK